MGTGKQWMALLLIFILAFSLAACHREPEGSDSKDATVEDGLGDLEDQTESIDHEMIDVNLAGMTGTTALSMLPLVDITNEKPYSLYQFEHVSTYKEAEAKLRDGTADIAALPVSVAASLYNASGGDVQIAALNTTGALYLVSNGVEIDSMADLKGKELTISEPGATVESVLAHMIKKNNMEPGRDIQFSYETGHEMLVEKLISGDVKLAVLSEPFVTQVTTANPQVKIALDLEEQWKATAGSQSQLIMGCVVVRKEFAEQHKIELDHFLDEYRWSMEQAVADPAATGEMAEKINLLDAATIEKAIPNCNLVFIEGDEMENTVTDFLTILFESDQESVGGILPDGDFFYRR